MKFSPPRFDGIPFKASLAAEFEVADPNTAINKTANFTNALYLTLQMALRELVLQLRALQSLADSGSNTLALGLPNQELPVAKRAEKKGNATNKAEAQGE